MVNDYIPDRGDCIWLNFTPQAGHEQAGKRPAIVVSPKSYNKKTGLFIVCPITSKVKGYPFEVSIREGKLSGVILSDQIKSLDWRARKAKYIQKANKEIICEMIDKINLIVG